MPHKKNPDVWEIVRGRCNQILACPNEIALLGSNLPHGYHRDFQLLKEILFPALERLHDCLQMTDYMLQHLEVNTHIFENPLYETLFTVEEVNRRARGGMPFRDAYKEVGIEVNEGRFHYHGPDPAALKVSDLGHTHIGSIGNLCNDAIAAVMDQAAAW
jgi:argininosuccinate lyase